VAEFCYSKKVKQKSSEAYVTSKLRRLVHGTGSAKYSSTDVSEFKRRIAESITIALKHFAKKIQRNALFYKN
jgi:hypothetical protein